MDAVEQPRFIQTVQGKGYRFIAKVETCGGRQMLADGSDRSRQRLVRRPARRTKSRLRSRSASRPRYDACQASARCIAALALLILGVSITFGARTAWSRLPRRRGEYADSRRGDAVREPHGRSRTRIRRRRPHRGDGRLPGPDHRFAAGDVIGRISTRGYKGTGKSASRDRSGAVRGVSGGGVDSSREPAVAHHVQPGSCGRPGPGVVALIRSRTG